MLHTCSKGRFNINLFIERFDDLKIYKKAQKSSTSPLAVRLVGTHVFLGLQVTPVEEWLQDYLSIWVTSAEWRKKNQWRFKKLTTCSMPNLPRLQANTQIDWALVATKISSLSKTKWIKQCQSYSGKCRCSSQQKYCWNLMGAHKQLCRERLFKKTLVISIYLRHQSSLEQWHTQMLHVTGMFTKPCPLVHACGHMSPKSSR